MGFIKFFRVPRHQKFTYHPRYYDPRKEKLDEIISRAKGEGEDGYEKMKTRISRGFHSKATKRGMLRSHVRQSNMRLLVIIVILLAATYFLLSVYLPQLLILLG